MKYRAFERADSPCSGSDLNLVLTVLVSGFIVLTNDNNQERPLPVEERAQDPGLYGKRARVDDGGDSGTALCMPRLWLGPTSRHSWYRRMLQDIPIQGAHTTLVLRTCRWRCRLPGCRRLVFAERMPELAARYARRSHDLSLLVRLFGHQVDGRRSVRLLQRLGISLSGTTILRQVMRDTSAAYSGHAPRVLGLDDWVWSKGQRYGTILVDLETRRVVDVLPDRSSSGTAAWLKANPGAEIICRDRHGLYAQGAREGTPQARQVADCFHSLQNLRELLERNSASSWGGGGETGSRRRSQNSIHPRRFRAATARLLRSSSSL